MRRQFSRRHLEAIARELHLPDHGGATSVELFAETVDALHRLTNQNRRMLRGIEAARQTARAATHFGDDPTTAHARAWLTLRAYLGDLPDTSDTPNEPPTAQRHLPTTPSTSPAAAPLVSRTEQSA